MKPYLLALGALALTITSFAQLRVDNFKKWQFGFGYDQTKLKGMYAVQHSTTNVLNVDTHESMVNWNYEIKQFVSDGDKVTHANLEGLVYLLSRLASMGNKSELFFDFDTPLDPLTSAECKNVQRIPGNTDKYVFTNNHILDIIANDAINERWSVGINASCRLLGFPPRYTIYQLSSPANSHVTTMLAATFKVLAGLNVGYGAPLGKKAVLFTFLGANTGLNAKGYNTTNLTNTIQVKYAPFVSSTLFFGGRRGMYLSVYWEQMVCKDKKVGVYSNLAPNSATPPVEYKFMKISEQQLQIKLGIYLTAKSEA